MGCSIIAGSIYHRVKSVHLELWCQYNKWNFTWANSNIVGDECKHYTFTGRKFFVSFLRWHFPKMTVGIEDCTLDDLTLMGVGFVNFNVCSNTYLCGVNNDAWKIYHIWVNVQKWRIKLLTRNFHIDSFLFLLINYLISNWKLWGLI